MVAPSRLQSHGPSMTRDPTSIVLPFGEAANVSLIGLWGFQGFSKLSICMIVVLSTHGTYAVQMNLYSKARIGASDPVLPPLEVTPKGAKFVLSGMNA